MKTCFVLVVLLSCVLMAAQADKIQHFVTIMLENRAFDHLLGYMKKENSRIDGLTGKEYNLMNPFDPSSNRVYVSDLAGDVQPDPHHDIHDTIMQQFGGYNMTHLNPAPMNGFVANGETYHKNLGVELMKCHSPKTVPVISTLAREFALFNYWFASAPASTEPNRMYLHSGTSFGSGREPGYAEMYAGYPQKTIFQSLEDVGKNWKVYYAQTSTIMWFEEMRKTRYWGNYWSYSKFFEDAAAGTLPAYSFIEPRYFSTVFGPAEDQHPDHPVSAGEKVLKEVYEALRNGPKWNKTALLITYDEHGGFFDHVPSPLNGVPNPDGKVNHDFDEFVGSQGFNFTRLGVRVPAIIVSPWVERGTVVGRPNGPYPTSQYEHSSLCSTLKTLFDLEDYLTARDRWAGNFEFLFDQRTTPRTDCPVKLPDPVSDTPKEKRLLAHAGKLPLSGLQQSMMKAMAAINGEKFNELHAPQMTEEDGARYIEHQMKKFYRIHRP